MLKFCEVNHTWHDSYKGTEWRGDQCSCPSVQDGLVVQRITPRIALNDGCNHVPTSMNSTSKFGMVYNAWKTIIVDD